MAAKAAFQQATSKSACPACPGAWCACRVDRRLWLSVASP